MKTQPLQKIIESCADPQRARFYFDQLKTSEAGVWLKNATPEQKRLCLALFSGSQSLSELFLAKLKELVPLIDPAKLEFPRQKQGLRRELDDLIQVAAKSHDSAAALTAIRQFNQREMFRVGLRDLARIGSLGEVVIELSNLADISLEAVFRLCWRPLVEKLGVPYHRDAEGQWQPTTFCVLGLGKLGGQELNYSSDVDLLFVYAAEGHLFKTPPRKTDAGKGMTNHQFFTRLAENFVAEVTQVTPDGFLFRVDMRLRPEGNAGPLVRSLESYENFYAQWGQTWERMMLIKARPVAGDAELGHEFLETIQPFRYPRSLNQRVLHEIAAMKERTETEVVGASELDRDVKRGYGGIREIEFVAQAQQILLGGKNPFLQGVQTIPILQKLVDYKRLTAEETQELIDAYVFLRQVEHRLQMEANQQTHTIPTERKPRERLAKLMGFETLKEFEAAKQQHCGKVRRIYDRLLKSDSAGAGARVLPPTFEDEQAWKKMLAEHAFRDPDKAFRLIREFIAGPGYVHVSQRTTELARELLPRMLALCPHPSRPDGPVQPQDTSGSSRTTWPVLSDPDRVLARLDSFITAYGARSMLYELWTGNPSLFLLLVVLFDRSEFLAELAIREPGLVDELEASGRLRRSKTSEETLRDLRHGLEDEDQKVWIRKYFKAEFMRIGLRDILGLSDFEHNMTELSALADACLQYALEVVMRRHKLKQPPFAIIGMGKLGGFEVNYGSDLDVIFVADSKTKNVPALQKMAVDLMDLLSAKTELGSVFQIDTRLRPDGEKGLLVNTLKAYEEYYRNRAQLWEIQALTRIRAVAGDTEVGEQYEQLAASLTNLRSPNLPLVAFKPDWKKEIARMRLRIEKERTPAGQDHLAIKTGSGGLMDAEFIAQTWCLENGWQEPNTLRALECGRSEKIVSPEDAETLIHNYRELRRVESILRRWSYEGETELPIDPAPLYRVSVRCGFKDADAFMAAVKGYRTAIRSVYAKVLPAP